MYIPKHFKKLFLPTLLGFSLLTDCAYGDLVVTPVTYSYPSTFRNANYQANLLHQLRSEGVQVNIIGSELQVILGTDHFFRRNSNTELVPACVNTLNRVVALLRSYGNVNLVVSAHTDNVGTDPAKFERTVQQANTIMAYLWSQGIPLANMQAIGCGDTQPVSSNKTLDGSAANRRIEIVTQPMF